LQAKRARAWGDIVHSRQRLGLAILTFLCLSAVAPAPAAHADDAAAGVVELVADGLDEPSNLASPPDGRERIYVIHDGADEIRVIDGGRLLPEVFLDLSERVVEDTDPEDGILGLAFSPRFPQMPYVYVTFIDVDGDLVLSRFEVMPSGLEASAASEQILLKLSRYEPIHQCGHIEFGPHDGLLYLCVGDTQGNDDIQPIAQDPDEPRGKMLRLDVEPDAVAGARPIAEATPSGSYEIWATGLRNPWRFTFDPATADLYIPDVGRHAWEEINVLAAPTGSGGNFGWPLAEGNECVEQCDGHDLIWPVYEYPSGDNRCAVIGGAVYRGAASPDWQGVFVFSDHCSGEIWALRNAMGEPEVRKLAETDLMPSALGTRFDGEILITDRIAGAVWKLVLPDIEGPWIPADQQMFAMVTEARHDRTGWAQERLDRIARSRIWQFLEWLQPIRTAYRHLEELF
jgi:glucose/arabinose dehydrogenase